jgi:hypothetical protein
LILGLILSALLDSHLVAYRQKFLNIAQIYELFRFPQGIIEDYLIPIVHTIQQHSQIEVYIRRVISAFKETVSNQFCDFTARHHGLFETRRSF